jgi:predicted metal-dependent enzyme (double-stranded beta helix superfamily)
LAQKVEIMQKFTIEGLVQELKDAGREATDRQDAVAKRLRVAMAKHGAESIIAALEAAVPAGADIGELLVHQSDDLTLLYGRIPANFQSGIHDHTVFACIAQLTGEERSVVYEADPEGQGLTVVRTEIGRPGDVTCLPADAIHHIENPTGEIAAALHVYGGDFSAVKEHRSLWSHDHVKESFSFEKLMHHSVLAMSKSGNTDGLEGLTSAMPAAQKLVDALT